MSEPSINTIYLGNCLEIMRQWPDACVDHCIADPPFGIASGNGRGRNHNGLGWAFSSHITMQEAWDQFTKDEYLEFSVAWLKEVCRLVKPNGNIFIFGTFHNIYDLAFIVHNVLDRRILNSIVWYKPNAQPNITARTLTESTEQLIWAVNETQEKATGWIFNYWEAKELVGGKQMRNLWFSDRDVWAIPVAPQSERKHGKHPSQKPEELTDRIVAIATLPGDLILDPFSGASGTAISAMKFGRNYVLIENEPKYVESARKRIKDFEYSKYFRLFGNGGNKVTLSDLEKSILAEIPVPQADELDIVFTVPEHVEQGNNTRSQIAKELRYASRQGPYYADAAMALRLIQSERLPGHTSERLVLTDLGREYIATESESRVNLRRDIVLDAPIVKYVSSQLGITDGERVPYPLPQILLDEGEVAKVLEEFNINPGTARRRAHTFCSWLTNL